MIKTSYFFLFFLIIVQLKGQVPAMMDNNWELNESMSDEFDSQIFNTGLWKKKHLSGWGYGNTVVDSNVLLNEGCLLLELEKNSSGTLFTGQIESSSDRYLYGYYEISCKILDPGNYKSGVPYTAGLIPTFWTYYQKFDPSGCLVEHDEIDILEPKATTLLNAYYNSNTIWTDNDACSLKMGNAMTHQFSTALFLNWHKYAVEFLPDRVIYYFDDNPIFYDFNVSSFPTNDMKVVIALATKKVDLDPSTQFPQYQKVDYFRFYELKFDCANSSILENQTQFNSFIPEVKSSITIGKTGSYITVPSGSNLSFRMNTNCIIQGNFTVPVGSNFNVIQTPCY